MGINKALAVLALGAVVATAAACNVTETAYKGNPGGLKVAVVGDDLVDVSGPAIHSAMDDRFQTRIEGVDGGTVAGLQGAATDLAASSPNVIVLGTNDVWKGNVPTDTSLAELDVMLAKFPNLCKVIVNVSEQTTATGYDLAKAHAFNLALPARGYVADWDGSIAGNLSTYTSAPDYVIPNADGQAALAGNISGGVNSGCLNT
jgi:hypothetical protein